MAKALARLTLLAMLVALSVGLMSTPAQGFVGYFNCVLKPSNQWCDGRANGTYDGIHSWDYVEGWYPGAWDGTVTACEHAIHSSTGVELGWGATCATHYITHYYGNITCICYEAEVKQISGGPHSINGFADADY